MGRSTGHGPVVAHGRSRVRRSGHGRTMSPVARMVTNIASEPEEVPSYKGFQTLRDVGQGIDRVDYVHGDLELPPYPARGQAWRVEHELWRRVKRLGVWG